MLAVVVNHLMQGRVLNASANNNNKTAIIWLVEVIAYLSVDCYILISGCYHLINIGFLQHTLPYGS